MKFRKYSSLLIVDDDEDLRETIVDVCKDLAVDIVSVGSGEEALKLLAQQRFDMIASDLNLPGITGLELYHRLGEENLLTWFVLMTGSEDQVHKLKASDLAIDQILLKPFNMRQFVAMVVQFLITEEDAFIDL